MLLNPCHLRQCMASFRIVRSHDLQCPCFQSRQYRTDGFPSRNSVSCLPFRNRENAFSSATFEAPASLRSVTKRPSSAARSSTTMGLFGLGAPEIAVCIVVAALVLGPDKLTGKNNPRRYAGVAVLLVLCKNWLALHIRFKSSAHQINELCTPGHANHLARESLMRNQHSEGSRKNTTSIVYICFTSCLS